MICFVLVTQAEKQSRRQWRDRFIEAGSWLIAGLYLVTSPVSFPLLLLHAKLTGKRLRGKGLAFFFIAWMVTTPIALLLLWGYWKKGLAGVQTLLWIGFAGVVWAIIVFAAIRVLLEVVVVVGRVLGWVKKK